MLLADRGYDADWIRELAMKKGAWANIPPKSNRNDPVCFSPYLYRTRNRVERFFNRIKQCRRAATRYDKLAANYLAFVQLASIRLWLNAVNDALARISHSVEAHRGANQREFFCEKDFAMIQGMPRCRQSVAQNDLILEWWKAGLWKRPLMLAW